MPALRQPVVGQLVQRRRQPYPNVSHADTLSARQHCGAALRAALRGSTTGQHDRAARQGSTTGQHPQEGRDQLSAP